MCSKTNLDVYHEIFFQDSLLQNGSSQQIAKKDKLFFAPFLAATKTNDAPIGYGNTSSS